MNVPGPLPGPLPGPRRDRDEDETAVLLRDVLRREAEAVRPGAERLERVLAAAHAARAARQGPGDHVPPARVLLVTPPAARPSPGRGWLPVLAAASAVVILSAALGLVRLGMVPAPGLEAVAGGAAPHAAPAPHPPAAEPLPVYFVERQNDRWALVREFTPTTLTDPTERLGAAVRLAISGTGTDPDHTSVWRAAGLPTAAAETVTVKTDADGPVITLPWPLLRADPRDGAAQPPPSLALQQLVWTATATTQWSAPVRVAGPVPGAALFGTLTLDRGFTRDASDPRAPVWVSSLVDGQVLAPGRAVVQGDAVTTPRGTVAWRLLRPDGSEQAAGVATLRRENDGAPRPGERGLWEVILQVPREGTYEFQVSQPWPGAAPAGEPDRTPSAETLPTTGPDWVDTKRLLVASARH